MKPFADHLKSTIALACLQQVVDPELDLNVVDLGLIYELEFDEEKRKLIVVMTLSTRFCPMGDSIRDSVAHNLERNFPEYAVEVNLTFDPPWSYERISAEGKKYLNA